MRPESGGRFAHFHVYSELGRGAMGVVFSAYNTRDQRSVALKLLPAGRSAEEDRRARFRRESTLARGLRTPHAVPVLDAGEHDGELWLEMPIVPGEDLQALLDREGRLDVRESLRICGQVARALDDAHAIGLLHRDVKPANIRLRRALGVPEPVAMLCDFGLTRSLLGVGLVDPAVTATDEVVGSCRYMSPEQVGRRTLDGRSDLYALACVLVSCLTGEPPFADGDGLTVLSAHLTDDPPSLRSRVPALPEGLDVAVRRGLAKSPADRPPTVVQFVQQCRAGAGVGV